MIQDWINELAIYSTQDRFPILECFYPKGTEKAKN